MRPGWAAARGEGPLCAFPPGLVPAEIRPPTYPRIGRDRAARANHTHHLGNASGWVGNEENHQRHDGGIEPVLGKRKRRCVALVKRCATRRGPGAREGELRLGRINSLNFGRRASLDQQLCEGTVAATDIDPSQARAWRKPIEEHLSRESAPASHVPFVSSPVVVADLMFDHPHLPRLCQRLQMTSDPVKYSIPFGWEENQ